MARIKLLLQELNDLKSKKLDYQYEGRKKEKDKYFKELKENIYKYFDANNKEINNILIKPSLNLGERELLSEFQEFYRYEQFKCMEIILDISTKEIKSN